MPRQLLNQYARVGKMKVVAPMSKGGTGASTPEAAVVNLGGISRSQIGVPGGLVEADSHGRLPISILKGAGFKIGYAIEGPDILVHNQVAIFTLTNYNSLAPVAVSVDVGSVVVVNDEIRVTVPATGDTLTLTVGERTLVLPMQDFSPLKPNILFPVAGNAVQKKITVYTAPFKSLSNLYSAWTEISAEGGVPAALPDNAIGIEVEARRGASGIAYVEYGSAMVQFSNSVIKRKLERTTEQMATFYIAGSGSMRYRWVYPAATHISTDWELATDPDFTNVVQSSMQDPVNLTSWEITLDLGEYYVRSRYHGRPIE